ncbi:MAG: MBG domain-containing protein, partial [Candidatus Methylacidiphilales bacterium]
VLKKALTVRANDQTRFYGSANPSLTVRYTGLVAGETEITPAPTVTTVAVLDSLPGTYPITVSGAAHANYEITFEGGTLTVRDGDQDGDGVGDSAEVAAGTDPNNPADRPAVLSAGWNHTLYVPIPGQTALAWGVNTDGRCGLGHTDSPMTSGVQVVGVDGVTALTGIIAVAAGGNHSLVLTRAGGSTQVWAAGTNANGQLGLTNTGTDRFRPISGLPANITALAAGAKHSLALAADGKLYAWGDNVSGQIGVNTNRTVIRAATLVSNLGAVTVKAIGAGAEHSLALGADGKVYSWGRPNGGALGYAGINPVRVPQPVTALTKQVVQIAAGDRHSLFLTEEGEVYASGINSAGQLGLPASVVSASTPTKLTFPAGTVIRKLVTGLNRAHAIATDGKVFAWGYNRYGELGLGVATTVEPFAVFVPTEVPALFGSKEIAGGGFQTFALDASGTLLASGLNDGGQLGVGSTNTVTTGAPAPTKQAGKVDQTITFTVPPGPFSTATTLTLSASSDSGLNPVYTSSDPTVATVEGSTLQFLAAGSVRITATQPGDDTRNAAIPVSRTLAVEWDTTVPVVTLNGPAVINLYVGDTFADPGATALDPVDGILTDEILVTGFVNTAVAGSYTLTYQVQDAAGNLGQATRTVNVATPPELTLQLAATPLVMTNQAEGTNAAAVDPGLQILGRPAINLTAATVKIVSGRQAGDMLAFSGYAGPLNASYNANSGTLRISGTNNLAGYQEALRKVILATTNKTV